MSKFIDKLNRLSRTEPQPIGFRIKQPVSSKPKIQLVASLAQENAEKLIDYVDGADAGLLRISGPNTAAGILQSTCQAVSDIPWGGWLANNIQGEVEQILKADCDFLVFPAVSTPLALLQNEEVGKILEVAASTDEGLLRATNQLPIDAVLITSEQKEDNYLTWQHLMLFQRFADLLTRPLLVSVPLEVTAGEFQALWEAGVDGVVIEIEVGQPQDKLRDLRQVVDKLVFSLPRKREKREPLLPRPPQESGVAVIEEEEEEE